MIEDEDFIIRYDVVIEYKGHRVLDPKTVAVLKALKEKGSILGASRALGIPYSKLYELITRLERLSGRRIVEARRGGRGGGGVLLTEFGEKLLSLYEMAWSKLVEVGLSNFSQRLSKDPDIVVAHSHDPLLSIVFSALSRSNVDVRSLCLGSGLSLAMLSLELADVACVHLYDPETKTYNRPFLERFWLSDRVELAGGYMREVVFVYRPDLKFSNVDEIVLGVLRGELTVANRNRGSGTRILLDAILNEYAARHGTGLGMVRGLGRELYTHDDVAKYVKQGKADVGLTIRYIAEKYGLGYVHLTWESFECYTLKTRTREAVSKFTEFISSNSFKELVQKAPGYRPIG